MEYKKSIGINLETTFKKGRRQNGVTMRCLESSKMRFTPRSLCRESRPDYGISRRGRTDRGHERKADRKGLCLYKESDWDRLEV